MNFMKGQLATDNAGGAAMKSEVTFDNDWIKLTVEIDRGPVFGCE